MEGSKTPTRVNSASTWGRRTSACTPGNKNFQSGESSSTMESPSREIPSKNDGLLMTSSLESDAAPPSAFDLLIQGVDQTIHIPPKTILVEVMRKMPAKEIPAFKCTKYSSDRFEATVSLNVSGSRVAADTSVNVVTIIGDIAATPQLSQLSAVNKAFEYLEKEHFVQVKDYSSEVVHEYEDNMVWGYVNSVVYTLGKVLVEWSAIIDKIENFHLQLERNENLETTHSVRSGAGDIYAESENFVGDLLTRYREKYRANESAYRGYEARRSKYLRESEDKVTRYRMKGYRQVIRFTMKDVLGCVLTQLGLSVAEYINEPSHGRQFTGEVLLQLPDIEHAGVGGRTRFHGSLCLTAAEAEQDAAHKALRFMESRLKLSIVDMNYLDKVEAEAVHHSMVILLRNMIRLAENIGKEWCKMNEYMYAGAGIFDGPKMRTVDGVDLVAVKYCNEAMVKLNAETNIAYEAAVAKIKELKKYYPTIIDYDD